MSRLKESGVPGVKGSHTTPYHTQGNGQIERFSCTPLPMLCMLEEVEEIERIIG